MAKPWIHAKNSAKKYGGEPEDYIEIHQFMDSSKAALADHRHRAILHSSFGCFIVEKVFGYVMTNSDGREFCPRDIAEQHCLEDLGKIPTIEQWLEHLPIAPWMGANKGRGKSMKKVEREPPLKKVQCPVCKGNRSDRCYTCEGLGEIYEQR